MQAAIRVPNDLKAYMVIYIDEKGQCSLETEAQIQEIAFMNKVADTYFAQLLQRGPTNANI